MEEGKKFSSVSGYVINLYVYMLLLFYASLHSCGKRLFASSWPSVCQSICSHA